MVARKHSTGDSDRSRQGDAPTPEAIEGPDSSGTVARSPEPERGTRGRPDASSAGYTVRDLALRYRVGEDTVRGWIRSGELRAINRAATKSEQPRWVVTPEALADFERGRQAPVAQKNSPRRRRRQPAVDYFPD
jgi:hypothetical protein